MARTHIFLDFFGTLVDYSASRTEQGYESSHELLRRLGASLTYQEFLDAWSRALAEFDRMSDRDDREFSMAEAGTVFLAESLARRRPRPRSRSSSLGTSASGTPASGISRGSRT
ncbi:hypothetical protein ACFQX6_19075 [Streptosporangium lutulentum]